MALPHAVLPQTTITDQKIQILHVNEDFDRFLLPQKQMICGPSMSGILMNFFLFKL